MSDSGSQAVPPAGPKPSSSSVGHGSLRSRLSINSGSAAGNRGFRKGSGAIGLKRSVVSHSNDIIRKGEDGFEDDDEGPMLLAARSENKPNAGGSVISPRASHASAAPTKPNTKVVNFAGDESAVGGASLAANAAQHAGAQPFPQSSPNQDGFAVAPGLLRGALNATKFAHVADQLTSGALEYCYVAADPKDP